VTGPLNGLLSNPIFNMGLLVPSPLLPFGRRAGVGKREVIEGKSCFYFFKFFSVIQTCLMLYFFKRCPKNKWHKNREKLIAKIERNQSKGMKSIDKKFYIKPIRLITFLYNLF
jgi:hypothetical protein